MPAGEVYPELVLQTHRSANRPIPVTELPVEPEPEPLAEEEIVDEQAPADPFSFDGIGTKRGDDPPPDDDHEFPGIKV